MADTRPARVGRPLKSRGPIARVVRSMKLDSVAELARLLEENPATVYAWDVRGIPDHGRRKIDALRAA